MNKMATQPMTRAEAAEAPNVEVRKKVSERGALKTILMLIVPALLIIGGAYYWLTSGGSVSTDDAQVKQDIVSVSPQVNGQVVEVFVRNGSRVHRGDLLFRIDPQPYRVALEQAQATLANARLQTQVLQTTAAGTGGDITGAEANLAIKRNALGRQSALLKQGFTTPSRSSRRTCCSGRISPRFARIRGSCGSRRALAWSDIGALRDTGRTFAQASGSATTARRKPRNTPDRKIA